VDPIRLKIKEYVDSLPPELSALRDLALRYLPYCSSIDTDGKIQIAHRPWVAPLNYSITLFPPAKKTWIKKFKGWHIPDSYRDLLLATNALFAFGLSLYGLTPSLQGNPPLLDRSRLQCLDIGLANQDWIFEYEVDRALLYFGGKEYSFTENSGYFMSSDGQVQAIRKSGKVLGRWDSLAQFLQDELNEAEATAKKKPDFTLAAVARNSGEIDNRSCISSDRRDASCFLHFLHAIMMN
jgi:hypothetical protein